MTDDRRLTTEDSRRGFTLIEVIITLVILSVLAALAIPAFLREPVRSDLDDAQGRLEALFVMARDSAVRTATPVTLSVDSASGMVWFDSHRQREAQPAVVETGSLPGARGSMTSGASGNARSGARGSFGGGSTLGSGTGQGGVLRPPANGQTLDLRPSIQMQLFRTRALFTFSPSGTVTGDSIILRSSSGQMRMITLDPWTADVLAR